MDKQQDNIGISGVFLYSLGLRVPHAFSDPCRTQSLIIFHVMDPLFLIEPLLAILLEDEALDGNRKLEDGAEDENGERKGEFPRECGHDWFSCVFDSKSKDNGE